MLKLESLQATIATEPLTHQAAKRFYQPELDALRFIAFFFVFLTHGPRMSTSSNLGIAYNRIASVGIYGLSLFFFLSSYLITELLLRELEKAGRIDLVKFYIRRSLRIWPLYFLAVGTGVALSYYGPPIYHLTRLEKMSLLLFVGYLPGQIASPIGHLWSISVEELFYLVWPTVVLISRSRLVIVSACIFPLAIAVALANHNDWFNPFAQFAYFSTGAMMATWTHNRDWKPTWLRRVLLLIGGLMLWLPVPTVYGNMPFVPAKLIVYSITCLGCACLFLALFRTTVSVPSAITYLGSISYGLYVFHLPIYRAVEQYVLPSLGSGRIIADLLLTFILTIAVSALSFHFYETQFLKLKKRFEVVRTSGSGNPISSER